MSENCKEEFENPGFDAGDFSECKSARPSPRARGPILSRADKAWLKEKEKSRELDVVVRDLPQLRVEGDSFLSRRGYRRNISDHVDIFELEDNAEQLKKIANEVLHGRNATVFQALVIDPLMRLSKRSVEDLAEQFGVTPRKIYKIKERCKLRIARALAKHRQNGSVEADTWKKDPERALQEAWGRVCPECGRPWILSWHDVCPPAKCWFFRHK